MSIDYKQKAEKYKNKYFNLLQQKGGGKPLWYVEFEKSLIEIDDIMKNNNQQHILTGTSAIAYILNELGLTELLDSFEYPNDIDYLYDTQNGVLNVPQFGEFVRDENFNIETDKKICYKRLDNGVKRINIVDFTGVYHIKHSQIGNFDVVNVNTLYNMYLFCNKEKNIERIKILQKILDYIKQNGLEQKYDLIDSYLSNNLSNNLNEVKLTIKNDNVFIKNPTQIMTGGNNDIDTLYSIFK
jgi:hypothetical protein